MNTFTRKDFLVPSFLTAALLAVLDFFVGGGVMTASSFALDPLFLEISSGWMLGKTPPAAMVTPLSNCTSVKQSQEQSLHHKTHLIKINMISSSFIPEALISEWSENVRASLQVLVGLSWQISEKIM